MKKETPVWAYALVILGICMIAAKLLGWHDRPWWVTTLPLWIIFVLALVLVPVMLLIQLIAKWYYRGGRNKALKYDRNLYPMFVTHKKSRDIYYMRDPENGIIFHSSSSKMKGNNIKIKPTEVEAFLGKFSVFTFEDDYSVILHKADYKAARYYESESE
jgi:hypothetical protein